MDRHERFIADETADVLPGISVLKCKVIDLSVEFCGDLFMFELTASVADR